MHRPARIDRAQVFLRFVGGCVWAGVATRLMDAKVAVWMRGGRCGGRGGIVWSRHVAL